MQLQQLLGMHCNYILNQHRWCHSLLFSICQKCSLGHPDSPSELSLLNHHLSLVDVPQVFYECCSLLLFNVVALNHQYIDSMQQKLQESTATALDNQQLTLKQNQECIHLLQQANQSWVHHFLTMPILNKTITAGIATLERAEKHRTQQKVQQSMKASEVYQFLQLLEITDYMCNKYHIETQYQLEGVLSSYSHLLKNNTNIFTQLNPTLFDPTQLIPILTNNHLLDHAAIVTLLRANYHNNDRPVFSSTPYTGKEVIVEVLRAILKNNDKNAVFGEKMNGCPLHRLIYAVMFNSHATAVGCFLQAIVLPLLGIHSGSSAVVTKIEEVGQFLRTMGKQHPELQCFLRMVYLLIKAKYGTLDGVELMKKLLLNRLLLNPEHLMALCRLDAKDMQAYLEVANKIRRMFYPKNVDKDQYMLALSNKLNQALLHLLEDNTVMPLSGATNDLYISEALLTQVYSHLKDSITISDHSHIHNINNSHINNINNSHINNSYVHNLNNSHQNSISFSFLKNQSRNPEQSHQPQRMGALKKHVNRQVGPKEHERKQSNVLLGLKSQTSIIKATSREDIKVTSREDINSHRDREVHFDKVKMAKTKPLQLSEEEMLDTLLKLRREYGDQKRNIQRRVQHSQHNRQQFKVYFDCATAGFNQFRKQTTSNATLRNINTILI